MIKECYFQSLEYQNCIRIISPWNTRYQTIRIWIIQELHVMQYQVLVSNSFYQLLLFDIFVGILKLSSRKHSLVQILIFSHLLELKMALRQFSLFQILHNVGFKKSLNNTINSYYIRFLNFVVFSIFEREIINAVKYFT